MREPTIEIPEALLKRIEPHFGRRFIKVEKPSEGNRRSGKQAIENRWQEHPYNAREIKSWLERCGNYGIIAGEGLYFLDIDDPATQKLFEEHVSTFAVVSGSGRGKHYFFRSNITQNGVLLSENNEKGVRKNLGNVQARAKYVVGAGSRHWSGRTYEIEKDVPFAWVSKEQLEQIFENMLFWTGQQRKWTDEQAKEEANLIGLQIPMADLVDLNELRQLNDEEFQGSHPCHGSTTGQNFCVNIVQNVWFCFRCSSGGGPLSWLAVKHGLIDCHEARKGKIRGTLFFQVVEIAKKLGYDIELAEEEDVEPDVARFFEGFPRPRFVPAYVAEELMLFDMYKTRISDKTIFRYDILKGIYRPDGAEYIMKETKRLLGKANRKNRQSEVINDIISSTLQEIDESTPNLLCLENGIFNLEKGKLEPFSKDYFFVNQLPIKYDPEAKCSRIMKFVKQIVAKEDIPILQEVAGYCLLREYPIHKAIMLVGEGRNGKSTFLSLLTRMLGHDNVSNVPLQTVEDRFATAGFYGKMANICADLSDKALRETGIFKQLTGGDRIQGQFKFKNPFNFDNYAKLIFSANKIPETREDTTAFFSRWIIVNFPNQFMPDDPKTDHHLIKKLTTEKELSGFFNWAVEGLRRLTKTGMFTKSKSVEETRQQYIRASDPIKAFVDDCIEFKAGNHVAKRDLYRAFIQYCQRMKLPTVPMNVFSMRLREHVANLGEATKKIGGVATKCWRDIAIKQETEEQEATHF